MSGEPLLGARFASALVWAHELHREQRRKGDDVPYVAHLLAVAGLALEHGADEDAAIAALLHDAVEDQGGPPVLAEIERRFGPRVARIVAGCTDTDLEPGAEGRPKPDWRGRKERYLAHLEGADPDTLLVSACDKLHNARAVLRDHRRHGDRTFERFRGRQEGTLWYYRAVADAFARLRPGPLARELLRTVAALEARAGGPGLNAVRTAQRADAEGIARVHVRAWQGAYAGLLPDALLDAITVSDRTRIWERILGERDGTRIRTLVLEHGDELIGFSSAGPTRDDDDDPERTGEVAALYVLPRAWGTGAGQTLLAAALTCLRAEAYREATLWTLVGNERAERFYAAAGFRLDGATKVGEKHGAELPERRWRLALG
ncbi:MAG: GNAT family N-acetyltransferase [Planctomycetota bacterium]